MDLNRKIFGGKMFGEHLHGSWRHLNVFGELFKFIADKVLSIL